MAKIVTTLFLLSPLIVFGQNQTLQIAYSINENDLIPEGIAYDPGEKIFYVSSTYKRKIININSNGGVSDFKAEQQDNLFGVLGMRVDSKRRVLWAASSNVGEGMPIKNSRKEEQGHTGLYKYDLRHGQLMSKYLLHRPGERSSLNDLTLDSEGIPFITDTPGGKILTINTKEDKLENFFDLPGGFRPNGIDITPDDKYLFVALYGSPKPVFARIDRVTKDFLIVNLPEPWKAGADGLYFYKNSLIAIMPGETGSRIVRYALDNTLLNIVDMKILVDNDPLLSQPTTGVVVGDKLYFVATSNLQLFAKLFAQNNGHVDSSALPPVRIGVVSLN